jgi:hypothetical protein
VAIEILSLPDLRWAIFATLPNALVRAFLLVNDSAIVAVGEDGPLFELFARPVIFMECKGLASAASRSFENEKNGLLRSIHIDPFAVQFLRYRNGRSTTAV